MTKRFGFTLAEVLITLGIIGVVAAMTIPTLMNQTNSAEFKTGFKKVISTLNQAVTMNVALDSSDFSTLSAGNTTDSGSIANMFVTRMNVVKTTNNTDTGMDLAVSTNYTLYFNDGMVISFPTNCANKSGVSLDYFCDAVVDINGLKKPNKLTGCPAATATGATPAETVATTACTTSNIIYGDRFSIRFGGQQVVPNGNGARFTLYN